jgi:4-amino-4-deoxy-L-arabinose transferase-like glycosyltransferase
LEKVCLPLLLVISFVTIFFQLGARILENQCYIRYAEVAREMIRLGDWIVPRLEGELFLNKPALIIWLIALPSAFVGKVTPLLAKLPSALSAVAIIGLAYFLGKRMFRNFRVGAIAGLILLSSKEIFWQARTARADMVVTLFLFF